MKIFDKRKMINIDNALLSGKFDRAPESRLIPAEKAVIGKYQPNGPPAKRRAIVLAATREFLRRRSYAELNLEEIAHIAGLSRRTINNQFLSKDDLYKISRESLLFSLTGDMIVEIPERMEPVDGMLYFAQAALDIFADPRNIEYVSSVARDSNSQPWLADQYSRHIRLPLMRICEVFILNWRRRKPLPVGHPRMIAQQYLSAIDALARGPKPGRLFGIDGDRGTDHHLEIVAKAYSSMINENRPAYNL